MNILIIDEFEPNDAMSFDFLNNEHFTIIDRVFAKNLNFSSLKPNLDLIVLNLSDVRDYSGQFIRKLKTYINKPLLGVLHVINDAQISLAQALGVDDCVYFPFSPIEFTARIKSLTRHLSVNQSTTSPLMQLGSIEINMDKYEVKRDGVSIPLTRTEFMILKILASNPEKVFLKEELYQKLWNDTYYDNGNALNVHIRRLRKKIEKNPEQPDHIITKWGIGYKFES